MHPGVLLVRAAVAWWRLVEAGGGSCAHLPARATLMGTRATLVGTRATLVGTRATLMGTCATLVDTPAGVWERE